MERQFKHLHSRNLWLQTKNFKFDIFDNCLRAPVKIICMLSAFAVVGSIYERKNMFMSSLLISQKQIRYKVDHCCQVGWTGILLNRYEPLQNMHIKVCNLCQAW